MMSILVTGSEMLSSTYMQYNQHLKNHKVLKISDKHKIGHAELVDMPDFIVQ